MTRAECNKILEAFDRLWDIVMFGKEADADVADLFGLLGFLDVTHVYEIDNDDLETLKPFLNAYHKQEIKVGNTRFEIETAAHYFFLRIEDKSYIGVHKNDNGWVAHMIGLGSVMAQMSFHYRRFKLSELYREADDDVQ